MTTVIEPKAKFVNETAEQYHADKLRVSRSQLVDFIKSPWLYFKRHIDRDPEWQQVATEDMEFGTAFHAAALEGKAIEDLIYVIPEDVLNADGHRKGKPWQQWAMLHMDKPNAKGPELARPRAMLESLKASPAAMALLDHPESQKELSIHWEHDGVELRTRLDCLVPGECIVDLKTARSCDLGVIESSLEWDGYFYQAGMYQRAVEVLTGQRLPFRFIFVEKSVPYRTVVVEMDQSWIDDGWEEIEAAIARLNRRAASDDWHDTIGDAVVPMQRNPNHKKYRWYAGDDA